MSLCAGIKADGGRCSAQAMTGSQFCLNHDPSRKQENKRRGRRGGRTRGKITVELTSIREELLRLKDAMLEGEIERADASAAGLLLSYAVRCTQVELQAKEVEEFDQRLEAIEEALEKQDQQRHSPGSRRYPSQ